MEIYHVEMGAPNERKIVVVFSRDVLQQILDKYGKEYSIWVEYIDVQSIESTIYDYGAFGEIQLFQEENKYLKWKPYIGEIAEQFMEHDGKLLSTHVLTPDNPLLIEDLKSSGYRSGTLVIKTRCTKYKDGKVEDVVVTIDKILNIEQELLKLREKHIRKAKEMYSKSKNMPKNAIPVVYNGTSYRSKAECMACEDISIGQLKRYLEKTNVKQ